MNFITSPGIGMLDSRYVNIIGDTMTGQLTITGSADEVQLTITGNSSQTAHLQDWKNSSGTILTYVGAAGLINTTVERTETSGAINTFTSALTLNPGDASSVSTKAGLFTNTIKSGNIKNVTGDVVGVGGYALHSGSGTATALYGLSYLVKVDGGGTATTADGILLQMQSIVGSSVGTSIGLYLQDLHAGTVTTNYGIKIDDIDGGSTNYSIYTGAGAIYHGDTLSVNKTTTYQAQFYGRSVVGARSAADSGSITLGTTVAYLGRIDYNASGATIFYMDNTYDNAGAAIQFRLRTAGTPIIALALSGAGAVTLYDGGNLILGTVTGTKFGTATNQKLAFYNSTPIVQPLATLDLGTVLSNLGLRAAGTAYPITTSGAVSFTGGMTTSGGRIGGVTTVTDTYTVLVTDETVVCNKSTDFTVTMPTAVVGQVFVIKNIGAGNVTITAPGTDTFDEVDDDLIIGQYDCVKLQCRLANKWIKIT